jgi:capsular polysaccharide biosynthesis protein
MYTAIYRSLYSFYKKNLEKRPIVKKCAEAIYLIVNNSWIYITGKNYLALPISNSDFKVSSIVSPISQNVSPLVYKGPAGVTLTLSSSSVYVAPEVLLYEIENAEVIGATDFVLQARKLFFDPSFDSKYHVSTLERFSIGKFGSRGETCRIRKLKVTRNIVEAVNLTGGGSGNFAHCLNENLAKLAILEEILELKGIPLLVDDSMPKNLVTLMNTIKDPDRQVIFVGKFELVQISKLYHLTNPSFAPLDVKVATPSFGNYTVFSEKSTKLIRSQVRDQQKVSQKKPTGMYFFTRSAQGIEGFQQNSKRHLTNQTQVEQFLLRSGFEKINLESVGIVEMADLMRHAKIVVSPIGAALANTLFADPGLRVVALSPYFDGADYTYHARMMAAYGHKYVVAVGQQSFESKKANPNLPFEVNIEHLEQALSI